MKLSDLRNEEAIEALADMIEPASEILTDSEVVQLIKGGGKRADIAKAILKKHAKAVIALLAAIERKDPAKYEVNVLTLPAKLIELFNDPSVGELFQLQGQTATSFGSATANIEVAEK